MVDMICKCGKKYKAKQADLNRGWAKSCSKSCAATLREKKMGHNTKHHTDADSLFSEHVSKSNTAYLIRQCERRESGIQMIDEDEE